MRTSAVSPQFWTAVQPFATEVQPDIQAFLVRTAQLLVDAASVASNMKEPPPMQALLEALWHAAAACQPRFPRHQQLRIPSGGRLRPPVQLATPSWLWYVSAAAHTSFSQWCTQACPATERLSDHLWDMEQVKLLAPMAPRLPHLEGDAFALLKRMLAALDMMLPHVDTSLTRLRRRPTPLKVSLPRICEDERRSAGSRAG